MRRAVLLHPTPVRVGRLVDALLDAGAAAEALHLLRVHGSTGLAPSLFERAADVLGLPSAQAEIDRARASAAKPALQVAAVPIPLAPGARLSTGGPFTWTPEPTVGPASGRMVPTTSIGGSSKAVVSAVVSRT